MCKIKALRSAKNTRIAEESFHGPVLDKFQGTCFLFLYIRCLRFDDTRESTSRQLWFAIEKSVQSGALKIHTVTNVSKTLTFHNNRDFCRHNRGNLAA